MVRHVALGSSLLALAAFIVGALILVSLVGTRDVSPIGMVLAIPLPGLSLAISIAS